MTVLVYVREWSKKFYCELATKIFDDPQIITYSDFKHLGDVWTGNFIYEKKESELEALSENEIKEIYHRCRFLRSLSYEKAKKIIILEYNGVNNLFDSFKFEYAIIPLIDCYTLDIIERVSRKKGVPVISFVQNFIKGYSRFTIRGERIDLNREVSDTETNTVVKMLTRKDYKPGFSLNREVDKFQILKRCVRNMVKYKVYVPLKILTDRDKMNYRYNTKGPCNYFKIVRSIREANFNSIKDINLKFYKNAIYIPLHYSPESTVDYWCDSYKDAYYEDRILDIIAQAPSSTLLILKEHPAMYGNRELTFYKKIKEFPNTIIIHPYENSNQLLDMVDTVGVHTGSVGVEALLRDKRVICFTHNYYSDLHPNAHVVSQLTEEVFTMPIVTYDKKMFINNLLNGLFPYKYFASWKVYEESDDIDILANWCKKRLEIKND